MQTNLKGGPLQAPELVSFSAGLTLIHRFLLNRGSELCSGGIGVRMAEPSLQPWERAAHETASLQPRRLEFSGLGVQHWAARSSQFNPPKRLAYSRPVLFIHEETIAGQGEHNGFSNVELESRLQGLRVLCRSSASLLVQVDAP